MYETLTDFHYDRAASLWRSATEDHKQKALDRITVLQDVKDIDEMVANNQRLPDKLVSFINKNWKGD